LDLFGQQIRVGSARVRVLQAVVKLRSESSEVEVFPFDPALAPVENVVRCNTVRPRTNGRLATIRPDTSHDSDQGLLGGVFGVLRVPEHPQRQPVDVVLEPCEHGFEGARVAATGGRGERSQLGVVYSGHSTSSSALSAANSWPTAATSCSKT